MDYYRISLNKYLHFLLNKINIYLIDFQLGIL